MKKNNLLVLAGLATVFATSAMAHNNNGPDLSWAQWGKDSVHSSFQPVVSQSAMTSFLANITFDPNAAAHVEENEALLAHYQSVLTDANGKDFYTMIKGGTFVNLSSWGTQTWSETKYSWVNGEAVEQWTFDSDWIPVPYSGSTNPGSVGPTWEPVFHAALSGNFIYIPGAGGTVFKVDKVTGLAVERINPFGDKIHSDVFTVGPISVDHHGNVFYSAIRLDGSKPYDKDALGSWLVRVSPQCSVKKVSYASLTPGAPSGTDTCFTTFSPASATFPWPPAPDAVPRSGPCGSQRPALNAALAFAPDGTIYAVSRAHFNRFYGYVLAINPDLTPKWQASLRDKLNDGCNVILPANGQPGGCRIGSTTGVDPTTNMMPAGQVLDISTSSPTVAPDGNVYYGAYTRYNWAQGHMFRFDSDGEYLGAFEFGWDITPAIYKHDGTYSLVIKENHYGNVGSYCNDCDACPSNRAVVTPSYPEAYYITQLNRDQFSLNPHANMPVEWRFQDTEQYTNGACGVGELTNPNGWEWCVNAAAIDKDGVVYANNEDGFMYAIEQGGTLLNRRFLNQALGAAYTPVSIDSKGRIYAQNFGFLIVLGD